MNLGLDARIRKIEIARKFLIENWFSKRKILNFKNFSEIIILGLDAKIRKNSEKNEIGSRRENLKNKKKMNSGLDAKWKTQTRKNQKFKNLKKMGLETKNFFIFEKK